jgi:hypothetical protein
MCGFRRDERLVLCAGQIAGLSAPKPPEIQRSKLFDNVFAITYNVFIFSSYIFSVHASPDLPHTFLRKKK